MDLVFTFFSLTLGQLFFHLLFAHFSWAEAYIHRQVSFVRQVTNSRSGSFMPKSTSSYSNWGRDSTAPSMWSRTPQLVVTKHQTVKKYTTTMVVLSHPPGLTHQLAAFAQTFLWDDGSQLETLPEFKHLPLLKCMSFVASIWNKGKRGEESQEITRAVTFA